MLKFANLTLCRRLPFLEIIIILEPTPFKPKSGLFEPHLVLIHVGLHAIECLLL